jgi:hypothetical protein
MMTGDDLHHLAGKKNASLMEKVDIFIKKSDP